VATVDRGLLSNEMSAFLPAVAVALRRGIIHLR